MKLSGFIFFLFFISQNGFGQFDFKGKWKGVCLTEKLDSTKYKTCSLCEYNKKTANTEKPSEIELNFYLEDVTIKIGDYTSIKDFEVNKNQNTLEFYFAEKLYKFRIQMTEDSRFMVLKDEEQNIILFYKK
ncbi:MAG: hypothetical protein WCR21_07475 [Bacteroidota bacterium]